MYKNFQIEIRVSNKCLKPVKMYISIIKSKREKKQKIPQRQKIKKKKISYQETGMHHGSMAASYQSNYHLLECGGSDSLV